MQKSWRIAPESAEINGELPLKHDDFFKKNGRGCGLCSGDDCWRPQRELQELHVRALGCVGPPTVPAPDNI